MTAENCLFQSAAVQSIVLRYKINETYPGCTAICKVVIELPVKIYMNSLLNRTPESCKNKIENMILKTREIYFIGLI